jgi:hypothetical protein
MIVCVPLKIPREKLDRAVKIIRDILVEEGIRVLTEADFVRLANG